MGHYTEMSASSETGHQISKGRRQKSALEHDILMGICNNNNCTITGRQKNNGKTETLVLSSELRIFVQNQQKDIKG